MTVAVGSGSGKGVEVAAIDRMNTDLGRDIASHQARFARDSGDAASALPGLRLVVPVLVVLIGLLALYGLQRRIKEYR